MIVIGLTGSVSVGKSFIASHFKCLGIPVFDADRTVHKLYRDNSDLKLKLQKIFPLAIKNDVVDRKLLIKYILDDNSKLLTLEEMVIPFVSHEKKKFLRKARKSRMPLVVLDIPLLFEARIEHDLSVVVVTSRYLQGYFALYRRHMSKEQFEIIRNRQWPDHVKARLADYVIFNGFNQLDIFRQVRSLLTKVKKLQAIKTERKIIYPRHSLQLW